MGVSKIDICNLALGHLGMKSITSLTEGTPSSIACSNNFNVCRDDVFSEYRWPFATVSEPLVLASETVLGWDYIYTYPIKAARVWNVFDESTVDTMGEQEFDVIFIPSSNRRVICSNLQSAYAEYTYKVEDTSIFDSKFTLTLSYRLAATMAHTLIGSVDVGLKMTELYNQSLSEAKRVAYYERKKKPTQNSAYQNSRG